MNRTRRQSCVRIECVAEINVRRIVTRTSRVRDHGGVIDRPTGSHLGRRSHIVSKRRRDHRRRWSIRRNRGRGLWLGPHTQACFVRSRIVRITRFSRALSLRGVRNHHRHWRAPTAV